MMMMILLPLRPLQLLLLALLLLATLPGADAFRSSDNYTCFHAPAKPGDRRADKTRLRLVQFNVEFFFLDHSTGGLPCPGPDCPWHDDDEARAHFDRVAAVVKELRPDILNLCEVEGCDEVDVLAQLLNEEEVQEDGGVADPYSHYLVKGTDSFTGQNVALLSKLDPVEDLQRTTATAHYPITGSQCGFTGQGSHSGVSKHYFTTFEINGMKVALVGIHLLARPIDPQRCAEREAQATVVRSVVDGFRLQGYEIVVLGDFNDFDDEVLDVNENRPTSRVLDIIKGTDLVSAAEFVPQAERYTDWWDKNGDCKMDQDELDMIDHVLLSPALAKKVSAVYMYHGYPEFCGTLDSDHWPVVVDFDFGSPNDGSSSGKVAV